MRKIQSILKHKSFDTTNILGNKTPKTINDIIIQFADQKFTNLEFIAFLAKTSKYISIYMTDSEMLKNV